MWRQKSKTEALKDYLDGKRVLVMEEPDNSFPELGGTVDLLDELFRDMVFLVDVKAGTVNPEFEAAVQEMVGSDPAGSTPPHEKITEQDC